MSVFFYCSIVETATTRGNDNVFQDKQTGERAIDRASGRVGAEISPTYELKEINACFLQYSEKSHVCYTTEGALDTTPLVCLMRAYWPGPPNVDEGDHSAKMYPPIITIFPPISSGKAFVEVLLNVYKLDTCNY